MVKLDEARKRIYEVTGYMLRGYATTQQVLTRKSVVGAENNEIFEMYGDAILKANVMQILHERLGIYRDEDSINYKGEGGYALRGIRNEGELHAAVTRLISNETLAKQIDKWDMAKYLIMSQSDERNQVGDQVKTKADLFEAMLGAVAVACKFNAEVLRRAVERMLPIDEIIKDITSRVMPSVNFTIDTAVTVLKELSEKGFCSVPKYEYSGPEYLGYYENGDPVWSCRCTVSGRIFIDAVFANSKKTAKKVVSYMALCKFFEITNPIAQYKMVNNASIFEKDGKYLIVDGFHKAPKEEDWNNAIKL